jgi:hypothetical protein
MCENENCNLASIFNTGQGNGMMVAQDAGQYCDTDDVQGYSYNPKVFTHLTPYAEVIMIYS